VGHSLRWIGGRKFFGPHGVSRCGPCLCSRGNSLGPRPAYVDELISVATARTASAA